MSHARNSALHSHIKDTEAKDEEIHEIPAPTGTQRLDSRATLRVVGSGDGCDLHERLAGSRSSGLSIEGVNEPASVAALWLSNITCLQSHSSFQGDLLLQVINDLGTPPSSAEKRWMLRTGERERSYCQVQTAHAAPCPSAVQRSPVVWLLGTCLPPLILLLLQQKGTHGPEMCRSA
jgi:hypothetical protein